MDFLKTNLKREAEQDFFVLVYMGLPWSPKSIDSVSRNILIPESENPLLYQ